MVDNSLWYFDGNSTNCVWVSKWIRDGKREKERKRWTKKQNEKNGEKLKHFIFHALFHFLFSVDRAEAKVNLYLRLLHGIHVTMVPDFFSTRSIGRWWESKSESKVSKCTNEWKTVFSNAAFFATAIRLI